MSRPLRPLLLAVLALLFAPPLAAQVAPTTRADSTRAAFLRAQRLVNDGQGADGRKLVDSLLNAAEPGSPEEAEALWWRATLAESWDAAQRDYLRLMLEHERSPRAGEAMLRLAQGEAARGDREAAVRYLERLAREAPESPARAEGGLWHGRLLIEQGKRDDGCRVLRAERARVPAGALELENQYDYLLRGCPEAAAPAAAGEVPGARPGAAPGGAPSGAPSRTTPATRDSTPRRDSTPARATPSTPRPAAAAGGTMWSVQAAALRTRAEADALVARLRERGYDARVDGSEAPFRVRFGFFPTRAAAAAALERYKSRERSDGFLVEVPRP